MSSTRHAAENVSFSQEAYASSNAHETGLLGNLVARRCKASMRNEHRAICYFLQHLSHRDGGLQAVVSDLVMMFRERFRTVHMEQFGIEPRQTLLPDERRAIMDEFPGTYSARDLSLLLGGDAGLPSEDKFPWTFEELSRRCRAAARRHLEEALRAMCLDPRVDMDAKPLSYHLPGRRENCTTTVWYIADLVNTLELYRQRYIEAAKATTAETTVTRLVCEAATEVTFSRGLAIVEGDQRTGKTKAARYYCDTHPGESVFIDLEAGNDETTFYRSLARSIGVASSGQLKAIEMRGKIEDMLQAGHLTVIIDEAHFLIPLVAKPKNPPKRLGCVHNTFAVQVAGVERGEWTKNDFCT